MIITTDKSKNEVSAIVNEYKLNVVFNGEYYTLKNGMKKKHDSCLMPMVEFHDINTGELVKRYFLSAIMLIPDKDGFKDGMNICKKELASIKKWLKYYTYPHTKFYGNFLPTVQ